MMSMGDELTNRILNQHSGQSLHSGEIEAALAEGKIVLERTHPLVGDSSKRFFAFPVGTDGAEIAKELIHFKACPRVVQLSASGEHTVIYEGITPGGTGSQMLD